jgi:hypothetical protein
MGKTERGVATVAVLLFMAVGISSLLARERPPATKVLPAKVPVQAKELTVVGTLVDFQSYMTGKIKGKDPMKWSRECMRRGVPAALETGDGLIVLGLPEGKPKKLAEHAMKTVQLRGKLYEKAGLKYLEVADIRTAKPSDLKRGIEDESYEDFEDEPADHVEDDVEDDSEADQEEEPEEEPQPTPDPDEDDDDDSY